MPKLTISGSLERVPQTITDNDFYQVGEFWRRVLSEVDKEHLVHNLKMHLGNADKHIQYRQTTLFYKADIGYGTAVAKALGLDVDKVARLAKLSQEELVANTKK